MHRCSTSVRKPTARARWNPGSVRSLLNSRGFSIFRLLSEICKGRNLLAKKESHDDPFSLLSLFALPPRPAHNLARFGAGVFAVTQDLDAVNEDVDDTGRVLVRLVKRRVVLDARRVEHGHVGEMPLLKSATALNMERVARE